MAPGPGGRPYRTPSQGRRAGRQAWTRGTEQRARWLVAYRFGVPFMGVPRAYDKQRSTGQSKPTTTPPGSNRNPSPPPSQQIAVVVTAAGGRLARRAENHQLTVGDDTRP